MNSVPQPPEPFQSRTESENTILIVIEGPGDRTIRPRRPNIPYMPPPPKDTDAKEQDGDNKPST